MKKSGYIVLIWLVALLTFLAEKIYLHDYVQFDKFNQYAIKAGEILIEADQKLSGLTSAGQFNYLLWTEGLLTDELNIIKSQHPLIKDVLIFSPDFHLLAGTNDGFSDAGILSWLEITEREKTPKKYLGSEGFFHVYPVINSDKKTVKGFVVAVFRMPSYLNNGAVFVMDLTRSNIYFSNEGYFKDADKDEIHKRLLRLGLGEYGKMTLEIDQGKEIFWSFYKPLDIYIGFAGDKKEFFSYVFFYVFLTAILLTILVFMKTAEKRVPKLEVYEEIIQNNIKTLSEMKKGMEMLLRETPSEALTDVRIIREASPEKSSEFMPDYFQKQRAIAGEVAISDFILIDPLETKWFKPLKRKPEIPGSGRKVVPGKEAFSEELLTLMKEVSRAAPAVHEGEIEEPVEVQGDYRMIRKDPLTNALEKLYGVEDVGEELDIAIEYAKSYGRADGIAVMFFDRDVGCYTISLANGLELSWSRYFYLLQLDSVIAVGEDQTTNVVVSDEHLQNPYFRKRIPPEFLSKLGGIKILSISKGEVLIRVALFYWRDGDFFNKNSLHPAEAMHAIDTPGFARYFQEIMPALTKIYSERQSESMHPEESYKDIYNILKSFTIISDSRATVVHAVSDNALDKNFHDSLGEKSRNVLSGNERYIFNNPNHLIFLLRSTSAESVEVMLHEIGGNFEFTIMNYPDLGKNLFAYL